VTKALGFDGTRNRLIQEGELLAKYVEADAIPS